MPNIGGREGRKNGKKKKQKKSLRKLSSPTIDLHVSIKCRILLKDE
jgi:hypothetical protein